MVYRLSALAERALEHIRVEEIRNRGEAIADRYDPLLDTAIEIRRLSRSAHGDPEWVDISILS